MENTFGSDMKVISTSDSTFTINSSAKTYSSVQNVRQVYSGSKISTAWAYLKANNSDGTETFTLEGQTVTMTTTLDDSTHAITTNTVSTGSLSDEVIATYLSTYQINQNGTKLRAISSSSIPSYMVLDGEAIFVKQ